MMIKMVITPLARSPNSDCFMRRLKFFYLNPDRQWNTLRSLDSCWFSTDCLWGGGGGGGVSCTWCSSDQSLSLVGHVTCCLYFGSSRERFALLKSPRMIKRESVFQICVRPAVAWRRSRTRLEARTHSPEGKRKTLGASRTVYEECL